jgi:hypothetical protein
MVIIDALKWSSMNQRYLWSFKLLKVYQLVNIMQMKKKNLYYHNHRRIIQLNQIQPMTFWSTKKQVINKFHQIELLPLIAIIWSSKNSMEKKSSMIMMGLNHKIYLINKMFNHLLKNLTRRKHSNKA